jgi:hypothetical protein
VLSRSRCPRTRRGVRGRRVGAVALDDVERSFNAREVIRVVLLERHEQGVPGLGQEVMEASSDQAVLGVGEQQLNQSAVLSPIEV